MRVMKRSPWLVSLGMVFAASVVSGGHARADVTIDQPGSIVLFPKVISKPVIGVGVRDTIIQISNSGNMPVNAHCVYVNAAGFCSITNSIPCDLDSDCPGPPTVPAQESCVRQCVEDDFDIFLTGQQPTFWFASIGRQDTPLDVFVGLDPGNVKPVGTAFEGELKCVETDPTGAPTNGNHLRGVATLVGSLDLSTYNALAVQSTQAVNGDNDLNLGTEYNACPASVVLNHYAEGATDGFLSGTCVGAVCSNTGVACTTDADCADTVSTELTLMPCTEDLEDQVATPVSALALITNELEFQVSVPIQFDCWFNRRLTDIPLSHVFSTPQPFDLADVRTPFAKTRITPVSGSVCLTGDRAGQACTNDDPTDTTNGCPNRSLSPDGSSLGCRQWSGVVGVAEEFHTTAGVGTGQDAFNLHLEGSRPGDIIVVPPGP